MTRPSRDHVLMDVAEAFAQRSTCTKAHVGAVIARDGRILSTGYNGPPAGLPHCDHTCDCILFEAMDGPKHTPQCRALQPCTSAVHAEANAVAWAARQGAMVEAGEMFTTMSPCVPCSQLIVNAGLLRVVYRIQYRITDGLEMLERAGVEVVEI